MFERMKKIFNDKSTRSYEMEMLSECYTPIDIELTQRELEKRRHDRNKRFGYGL